MYNIYIIHIYIYVHVFVYNFDKLALIDGKMLPAYPTRVYWMVINILQASHCRNASFATDCVAIERWTHPLRHQGAKSVVFNNVRLTNRLVHVTCANPNCFPSLHHAMFVAETLPKISRRIIVNIEVCIAVRFDELS